MFDTIYEMFETRTFCDVVINNAVHCHSLVLCSALPALKEALLNVEQLGDSNQFHITIIGAQSGKVVKVISDIYQAAVSKLPRNYKEAQDHWSFALGTYAD